MSHHQSPSQSNVEVTYTTPSESSNTTENQHHQHHHHHHNHHDNNTTHVKEHQHSNSNDIHHGDGETRSAAIVVKSGPAINSPTINWEINLFNCGSISDCLFPCLCPFIASAYTRTLFDGSPFIFNFFCLGSVPTRYLIRTAYGINGSPIDDCLKSIFCSCCSANQLYQTVKKKGKLDDYNTIKYNYFESHQNASLCIDYCKATLLFQCYTAKALEISVGMPYMMGLCCMNPCSGRNAIRYHYRIDGHDIIEECLLPACLFTLAGASLGCGFPCGLCCVVPPLLETVVKIRAETTYRERSQLLGSRERRYIAGFYTGQKLFMEHNKRLQEKNEANSKNNQINRSTSFRDSLKQALGNGYEKSKKIKSKNPSKTQPLPENVKPSDIASKDKHHHHGRHHHNDKSDNE